MTKKEIIAQGVILHRVLVFAVMSTHPKEVFILSF